MLLDWWLSGLDEPQEITPAPEEQKEESAEVSRLKEANRLLNIENGKLRAEATQWEREAKRLSVQRVFGKPEEAPVVDEDEPVVKEDEPVSLTTDFSVLSDGNCLKILELHARGKSPSRILPYLNKPGVTTDLIRAYLNQHCKEKITGPEKVLEALANGCGTIGQIAERHNMHQPYVHNCVVSLLKQNKVVRTKERNRTPQTPGEYALASEDPPASSHKTLKGIPPRRLDEPSEFLVLDEVNRQLIFRHHSEGTYPGKTACGLKYKINTEGVRRFLRFYGLLEEAKPSNGHVQEKTPPKKVSPALDESLKAKFEKALRDCSPYLKKQALAQAKFNRDLADELYQIACIRGLQGFDRFQGDSTFKVWMTRIIMNAALDNYNKTKRKPTVSLEDVGLEGQPLEVEDLSLEDPLEALIKEESSAELIKRIEVLPSDQKKTAQALLDDLTYEEMADLWNVPIGTVKSRVSRVKEALMVDPSGKGSVAVPGGALPRNFLALPRTEQAGVIRTILEAPDTVGTTYGLSLEEIKQVSRAYFRALGAAAVLSGSSRETFWAWLRSEISQKS